MAGLQCRTKTTPCHIPAGLTAARAECGAMIVGIDIGGATTDAVLLHNGGIVVVTIETGDPVAAAAGALGKLLSTVGGSLTNIRAIAVSGGGARWLTDELFSVPVVKVSEITAIGVGGSTLAEKSA